MTASTREAIRRSVSHTRRPPSGQGVWIVASNGLLLEPAVMPDVPPAEIRIRVDDGPDPDLDRTAGDWLIDLAGTWGNREILVRLMACDGHRVTEAHWSLVSRAAQTATRWRFVLQTDGTGLTSMEMIDRLLSGPFDEAHFVFQADQSRWRRPGERLLMLIKDLVELRTARGQSRPLIAWRFEGRLTAGKDEQTLRDVRSTVRQLGVDRFEVVHA